jgi:NAD(P)-dependent dehydrogenase (short-subunit alcohol dehydrogenase family)
MSSGRLEGRIALITGAAFGMGATAAELFAQEGARVAVTDLHEHGEEVAAAIRETGGEAIFVKMDVADAAQVERGIARVRSELGGLDVLYNNAGIGPPEDAPIHELVEEVWDKVMDVNVRGMYLCCRFGIAAMLDSPPPRRTSIINTASIAGMIGNSTLPSTAYTVSKAAVAGITKQVAVTYAADGIRCNAMCPGPINTPILAPFFDQPGVRERFEERIPLGRLGVPEDVANLALFLASDESSFMTGSLIVIDGGITAT